MPAPARAPSARVPVPSHRHPLPLDRRPAQGADDLVRDLLGDLDEGEAVGDLDRADGARVDPDLVGDGADEIPGAHPGLPSGADVDPGDVPLGRAPLPARPFATLRAEPVPPVVAPPST